MVPIWAYLGLLGPTGPQLGMLLGWWWGELGCVGGLVGVCVGVGGFGKGEWVDVVGGNTEGERGGGVVE